jgi:protein phosphatase
MDRVRVGDRYLLCSDGLTRQVDDVQIASYLQQNHVSAVAHNLISAALNAGAPDNVTVMVTEAYAELGGDWQT